MEQKPEVRALINRWYNYMRSRDMEITPEDLFLVIQVNSLDTRREFVTVEDCREVCDLRG
jgi:hypothetical protein